ncbi:hypothetical protein C8F01DRAFT_1002853, partial [Mycena amicta]
YNSTPLPSMPSNYRYIHPERKRLLPIINITVPSTLDIAEMMEMSTRTVRRAIHNDRPYGDVVPPPKGQVGRLRAATGLDKFYLECLIHETPDLMLWELRNDLYSGMGIDLDESTIHRMLRQRGVYPQTGPLFLIPISTRLMPIGFSGHARAQ